MKFPHVFLDKVADVPVVVQRQGFGPDSAENRGGSAVAVHRQGGGSDIDERRLWRLGGVWRGFAPC